MCSHLQGFPGFEVFSHFSTFIIQAEARISGPPQLGCEFSAAPEMWFPPTLTHKGTEGWQSCTNYKDHKDTLKGHIGSFHSLSIESFIKGCVLGKGHLGKTDVGCPD